MYVSVSKNITKIIWNGLQKSSYKNIPCMVPYAFQSGFISHIYARETFWIGS